MASARKNLAVPRAVVHATLALTILLAAGAFTLSFASLTDLARLAGVNGELAWIWPLTVDGIIVAGTMAVIALAEHGRRALVYPWVLLAGGSATSITANALHAILAADDAMPAAVSAAVASVPPIALLALTHLAVVLVQKSGPGRAGKRRTRRGRDDQPLHVVEVAA